MILRPWFNYKINKAQNENLDLRKSIAYKSASLFGIVFCYDEQKKIEDADKLMTLLKMDGKMVKTIAYEHKNAIKHLPYDTFSKENFSFWGDFIGKPIIDFVNTEFDFLICLDERPNDMVRSILANSQSKCRVGRFEEANQQTFEMLLEDKNNQGKDWVDSMYQYLKILS
jgi:uncharacterized protein DUF6913